MAAPSAINPPDVVGHGWVLDLLQRGLEQGRFGHAYLITGPGHIGKFTTAMAVARLALCAETPACGACRHCTLARRNAHPDLQVLTVPSDRKTIPLRDVHELMRGMALRPLESDRKVYIIRGADDLAEEGANALLKTLEEPPSTVTIILTAPDAATLLPTIVSRCQVLNLRPVAADEIARCLTTAHGVEIERAESIAAASDGRPGWAILAAQDPELVQGRDDRVSQLLDLLGATRLERIRVADALGERWSGHADEVREALQTWTEVWHDVLLVQTGLADRVKHRASADRIRAAADDMAGTDVQRALEATLDLTVALAANAHPRLALEAYALFLPRLAHG